MSYESVQEMFSRTASECGSNVAIDRGGRRVTYAELEAESNRLANFLREGGVSKGSMVALFTDDPSWIITGILAVLKAGAVFVPLDPTFPDQRLRVMREQVEPLWYVVESKYLEKLGRLSRGTSVRPKVICLDESTAFEDLQVLDNYGSYARCEAPGVPSDPEAPCSIYFTSGSTGKPKAILGRLKGIDHFMRWEIEAVGAQAGTRVSQLASPSFDGFLKDAFVPLCSGGVVCAPKSRDIVMDPWRLADWLDVEQVEVLHCVPSVFRALINCGLESNYFAAMKCVVMTGEPLYPADVKRWMEVFGERIKLLNIYGTTETSLSKFYHVVQAEDLERPSIPVGKPIDGSRAMVIDSRGDLCGLGAVGEIYIQTPYRSFGYYREPELTREVFIQNPFSDDPDDIVHKTGDYGRWLKGGELEHLGRRDQQVQVRGVRVELGEIENLLRSHEAVADVAVIDRDDAQGNKFLVAYVTLNNGGGSEQLRQFLAERLPGTMLPSAFVKLDQLPRTLNGKIDRKALPTLEQAPVECDPNEAAPRTPVEDILAGIWCEVLRLPAVGRTDNFFHLGGHSLLVMSVVARIRKYLKVELSVRCLFEAPTIAELGQLVQEQMNAGNLSELTAITRVPRDGELPLSFSQQRMWFFEQLSGTSAYNMPLRVKLKGRLNIAALQQTFNEIVRRHESLRTIFPVTNSQPAQLIQPWKELNLPVVDLSGLTDDERELQVSRLGQEEALRLFDLANGPLLRLVLLRSNRGEHFIICSMHHIIGDGQSFEVVIAEMSRLYTALSQGGPSPLGELPIQYVDYAAWQRQWLRGEVLENRLAYWRKQLEGVPRKLSLPRQRPRPQVQAFRGANLDFKLTGHLTEGLRNLSRQEGVTMPMALLTGFVVLLNQYTGDDDIVVGTVSANRERAEAENLIGVLANPLVLRVDVSGDVTFTDIIGRVRDVCLDAYSKEVPTEMLRQYFSREGQGDRLFDVWFQAERWEREQFEMKGLECEPCVAGRQEAKFEMALKLLEYKEEIMGSFEYDEELFETEAVSEMMQNYVTLLEQMVAHPDSPSW